MYKIIGFIITADIILIGLFVFLYMLKSIIMFVKSVFANMGNRASDKVPPIEFPTESEAFPARYDVDGFRERMSELKADNDGLYDIPERIYSDESGVEIITQSRENEIERKMRP